MRPIDCAKEACDTLMRKYAPAELPPVGQFLYHQGVFLSGMQKVYHLCGERQYFDCVKGWVDHYIDAEGQVFCSDPGQMDYLMPGLLLYDLLEATGDVRYKKALDKLVADVLATPRNPEGGYWHKVKYPNEMWLDGLYMGGPIVSRYGVTFHRPDCFDTVIFQALMMFDRTRDPRTGLLYHAWDQGRQTPWCDKETGLSPCFWGRSIGWVPVAVLEELDDIPKHYFLRDRLEDCVVQLLKALVPYQDEATGLWYQVVDRGDDPRNWLETSCSCLYTAALCKAVRVGLLDQAYLKFAKKGYEGVIARLKRDENGLIIDGVCVGTGVGDYEHYLARPTSANDLHGVGAFLLMCAEAEQALTDS